MARVTSKFLHLMKIACLCLWFLFPFWIVGAQEPDFSGRFVFGKKTNEKGAIAISSKLTYNDSLGYGFDFNTAEQVVFNKDGFVTKAPVYFSVRLPEGNYKVQLVLGSGEQASKTTVKAESRRLMLSKISLPHHTTEAKVINVNVRVPHIDNENKIELKEREFDDLNWDDKLTLEFLGIPAVQSIKISPLYHTTTLFLAGDSTVADQDLEPWASWGQYVTQYFGPDMVIANYASSGASLSSFKARKRLMKILSVMQAGDYLFIEFGHNDQKQAGEGIGPWQSYSDLLVEFITAAREKGGMPLLLTPTQRRFFGTKGKLYSTHGDYPEAMRGVAKKWNAPLIDLTKMTTTLYESWGDGGSKRAFVQYPAHTFPGQDKVLEDNTHFNDFGANEIALCVVKGIKDLNLGLAKLLVDDVSYDPSTPHQSSSWTVPMSNRFEPVTPDGN